MELEQSSDKRRFKSCLQGQRASTVARGIAKGATSDAGYRFRQSNRLRRQPSASQARHRSLPRKSFHNPQQRTRGLHPNTCYPRRGQRYERKTANKRARLDDVCTLGVTLGKRDRGDLCCTGSLNRWEKGTHRCSMFMYSSGKTCIKGGGAGHGSIDQDRLNSKDSETEPESWLHSIRPASVRAASRDVAPRRRGGERARRARRGRASRRPRAWPR